MFTLENCRLRLMNSADLPVVLSWRNSDRIRRMMYTDHRISLEEHRAWFARAEYTSSSRHLIFEYESRPVGVVNVTAIDELNRRCHWGFYLGETDLPKGCGTAMGVLALDYMFNELGMNKVVGEVLTHNEQSLKYHVRLGFVEEGRLSQHVLRAGQFEDVIQLAHFADRWRQTKEAMMSIFAQEIIA